VVGLAGEDDARAAHADDRVHHADRDAGLLEPRALLDVELDVGGDGAGGGRRLPGAPGVEARARHRVDEPLAVDGRHLFDAQQVEHSAERARAEEAPVAPLLVAPRGDGERQPVHGLRLADRL